MGKSRGKGDHRCVEVRGGVLTGAGGRWLLKGGKSCRGPEEQVLLRMGVTRKAGKGRVRLSWASKEQLIRGPCSPKPRLRTHIIWHRSSVSLPDAGSSLKKGGVINILRFKEISVYYWDLRPNI